MTTTEDVNTQKLLDQQRIDRTEDSVSSLSSAEKAIRDKNWQHGMTMGQQVVLGGTVGLLKTTVAMIPDQEMQKQMQPLLALSQGVATVANWIFKAADKRKDSKELEEKRRQLADANTALEKLKFDFERNYGAASEGRDSPPKDQNAPHTKADKNLNANPEQRTDSGTDTIKTNTGFNEKATTKKPGLELVQGGKTDEQPAAVSAAAGPIGGTKPA